MVQHATIPWIPTIPNHSYGSELVLAGTMESDLSWGSYGTPETLELSDVKKHGGSYSMYVNDSVASNGGFYQNINVVTGEKYRFSYWYYLVSGTLRAQIDGATSQFTHTTTDSWQYAEHDLIYTGSSNSLYFINHSGSVAAEFYIDDVSMMAIW